MKYSLVIFDFDGTLADSAPYFRSVLNQLARNMARVATGRSTAFVRIYEGLMKESMPGWLAGWRLLFSRMRRKSSAAPSDWSKLLGTALPPLPARELEAMGYRIGIYPSQTHRAAIAAAKAAGMAISLGCDWAPSGSKT